jgi:polar amino acid transport system substrate-binding protein
MKKRLVAVTAAALLAATLAACSSDSSDSSEAPATTESTASSEAPVATEAPATSAATASAAECAAGKTLAEGKLTVATGNPAFAPWVIDDKPETGQGFEAAVAYAVAEQLGIAKENVAWIRTGFDEVIAPGPKDFDFNIQQYSITDEREKVVSFSDPYYVTNQTLVTFADSPFATATKISDLKGARLGAAVGTTSLDFIQNVIKPDAGAQVYDDNTGAKTALENKQIDGIIVDLPTSGAIAYGELTNGAVVGQFVREGNEDGDRLGMLLSDGNGLVACVNIALANLTANGSLSAIEDAWLKGTNGIPVIARD